MSRRWRFSCLALAEDKKDPVRQEVTRLSSSWELLASCSFTEHIHHVYLRTELLVFLYSVHPQLKRLRQLSEVNIYPSFEHFEQ